MFGVNAYAKVWNTENKGKFYSVDMSTSHKNKETNQYETDWSSKFVSFVGAANTKAANIVKGDRIKITNCGVTNGYNKEKNTNWVKYVVFDFEPVDGTNSKPAAKTAAKPAPATPAATEQSDLPF